MIASEYHPTSCAVCGARTTWGGRLTPFCPACDADWDASPEKARMISARNDFITRRKKEKSLGL